MKIIQGEMLCKTPYYWLGSSWFCCSMHAQVILNAMETFGLALKKIKAIFCALFGKIGGSVQKYHILMLNLSINL